MLFIPVKGRELTQALQRIDRIIPGSPLPFDAFDENGNLLLKKGYVVESAEQAQRLLARGLYSTDFPATDRSVPSSRTAGAPAPNPLFTSTDHPTHFTRVSVNDLLDTCHQKLDELMSSPPQDGSFPAAVRAIAATVQHACDLDPDAAIARNLVVRLRPHAIRHSLDCAILVDIVRRSALPDAAARMTLVCAALTMNCAALAFHERCYARPEPLESAERTEMVAHPEHGAQKLRELGVVDEEWIRIVRQHHESPNGSGYPAALTGTDIDAAALTLAIADRYCAMVAERAYRPARNPGSALQELLVEMGKKDVDAAAASRFIREIGIYPPGAVVTLNSGETAMVVARTLNPKHPVVRAITDPYGKDRVDYLKRTTSDARFAIRAIGHPGETQKKIELNRMWHPVSVETEDPAGSD